MNRYFGILIITWIVAVSADPVLSQGITRFDTEKLEGIQNYVGLPDSIIAHRFGEPDEVGFEEDKNAIVWTYITMANGETPGNNLLAAYHQFAFWNGKVAGYRTRHFTEEKQATVIYDSTLAYMGEGGRTIAGVGAPDSSFFTDKLRVSRRGDILWNVDMLKDAFNSHATIIVGDVGYRSCESAVKAEATRIEQKFGIKVTEKGRIQTQ